MTVFSQQSARATGMIAAVAAIAVVAQPENAKVVSQGETKRFAFLPVVSH